MRRLATGIAPQVGGDIIQEYAKNIDREYGEVPEGVVGPVQAKLQSFPPLRGWVFGVWGEASQDVHIMVDYLADARKKHKKMLQGR